MSTLTKRYHVVTVESGHMKCRNVSLQFAEKALALLNRQHPGFYMIVESH